MANNLNQLAKQANKSGFPEIRDAVRVLVLEIYEVIKMIRHDSKNNKG